MTPQSHRIQQSFRAVSYTSQKTDLSGLLREAYFLYRTRSIRVPVHIDSVLRNLRLLESRVAERFGVSLRNLDILDIGSGQFLLQMFYFAQHNRVVGIDWDIIPRGVNPIPYIAMFRMNGPRRAVKTIGRKLLGVDRRYRKALMKELNVAHLPRLAVQRMDACNMTFPDKAFDLVHSSAVFHHLTDPEQAVSEAARVLRPGGIAYIAFHLFTSETGSLDVKEYRDEQGRPLRWPHLRGNCKNRITTNTYVNKVRLNDWRRLFEAGMPEAEFVFNRTSRRDARADAEALMSQGELADYSLEELLVHDVTVLWQRPS